MNIQKKLDVNRYSGVTALHEHILYGQPVTWLEAVLLMGAANLGYEVHRLRNRGFLIEQRKIPMVRALQRINKYTRCDIPKGLPVNKIKLTEYFLGVDG